MKTNDILRSMERVKIPENGRLIETVQQHILTEQRKRAPDASGSFSWLLSGITLATKMIQAKVRRAGLLDIFGDAGLTNVQGEDQQKLDVYANQALIHCLGLRDNVAMLASEENDEPVAFEGRSGSGKYIVVFDPLDGSSNIDVNVSVGTIFSILAKQEDDPGQSLATSVLQPGWRQAAAGYVIYGSSTMLVFTTGHGVHGFTLDPDVGAFVLSHENMKMPDSGYYYSTNEASFDSFPPQYQRFITTMRQGLDGRKYSSRYIGSFVSDFHRTLLKGGVFLYPPTSRYPEGKLRLLYEANPLAFLAEQASGQATSGTEDIMKIQPTSIHQRVPLVIGSRAEVEAFHQCAD